MNQRILEKTKLMSDEEALQPCLKGMTWIDYLIHLSIESPQVSIDARLRDDDTDYAIMQSRTF